LALAARWLHDTVSGFFAITVHDARMAEQQASNCSKQLQHAVSSCYSTLFSRPLTGCAGEEVHVDADLQAWLLTYDLLLFVCHAVCLWASPTQQL
jgi:hypothetical protein